MATSRPTSPAGTPDRAAALARAFADQRPALTRHASGLLQGDSARIEQALQAALDELLATSGDEEVEGDDAEHCFAIAHRHAQNLLRQDDRARRFVEPPAKAAQPGVEEHTELLRHIERLTPKQQEVIRLKFQNGFGHFAIARIIDLPRDKVGALMHTALARLRAEFPDQTPVDDHRVTSLAFNEQTDMEREAFASPARDDAALEQKVSEIRAFAARVEEALAIEAGIRAPRRPAGARRERSQWLRRPVVLRSLAVVAITGVAVFFALRMSRDQSAPTTSRFAGDFKLRPASWQDEPADLTEKTGGSLRPDSASRRGPIEGESSSHTSSSFPNSASHRAAPTAPSDGPTTGEKVENEAAPAGPPDGAAAIGGVKTPSGLVDSGGQKSSAPKNAALKKDRDAAAEPPPASPESSPAEKAAPAPKVATTPPRPARLASKGPGARGGADFRAPSENPISDLPSETDTASVPGLLNALGAGETPAASAVRAEELLNYFPTGDAPPPENAEAFSASIESAEAPWNPAHRLVRIGLKGRTAPPGPRPRAHLVFLLDVSASMDLPERLPLVQEAARLLLGRLHADDRVAIVTYAAESQLMLPSTPAAESPRIRHVLGALRPAGQTNGSAGLQLAYTIAKAGFVEGGANRVILCTDGDFNLGLTGADALTALAAEHSKAGIALSVFGFGRGYRIDARLEALAAQGGGRSGYVNTRREAERVFAGEVDGLLAPIARDVRLDVEFNPGHVAGYRLIGYENPESSATTALPQRAATGVVDSGHSLTALYEIVPAPEAPSGDSTGKTPWLNFRVDYQEPSGEQRRQLTFPLGKTDGRFSDASADFKFSAALAGFSMILRDSPHRGSSTLADVTRWAEAGLGDDPGGYRSEFIALLRTVQSAATAGN